MTAFILGLLRLCFPATKCTVSVGDIKKQVKLKVKSFVHFSVSCHIEVAKALFYLHIYMYLLHVCTRMAVFICHYFIHLVC